MTKTTPELGRCQVRSWTERPCHRRAVVKIRGIPFCEPCAREQEAYFTIGELTETPRRLYEGESLVRMLDQMRRIRRRRHVVSNHEPDAA